MAIDPILMKQAEWVVLNALARCRAMRRTGSLIDRR